MSEAPWLKTNSAYASYSDEQLKTKLDEVENTISYYTQKHPELVASVKTVLRYKELKDAYLLRQKKKVDYNDGTWE